MERTSPDDEALTDPIDLMATTALFANLSSPELETIAHTWEEVWFGEGDTVLRQGLGGSHLYVILEGEASVLIDEEERARLGKGDFFGEVSALLDGPPSASVRALGPLRCLALPTRLVEEFLLAHPRVMYRMMQTEARRLRAAVRWRS